MQERQDNDAIFFLKYKMPQSLSLSLCHMFINIYQLFKYESFWQEFSSNYIALSALIIFCL